MDTKKPTDPDNIHFFTQADIDINEIWEHRKKVEAYEKHLKKLRFLAWTALILAFLLGLWWSENGRYIPLKEYYYLDSKTGKIFNPEGIDISSIK